MTSLPTLYKRSLKGFEKWGIRVENNDIVCEWGMVNGKTTKRIYKVKEGKNLGKSNATTSILQAENEAQSKWNKKVNREGYYSVEMLGYKLSYKKEKRGYYFPMKMEEDPNNYKTLNEVLEQLPKIGETIEGKSLPMLAKAFYDDKGRPRLAFPLLVQPKFNGVRCILEIDEKGKVRLVS